MSKRWLLLFAFVVLSCQHVPLRPPLIGGIPTEGEEDERTRSAARERWLFEQRAYPFGTVAADARARAFDAASRELHPAAEATSALRQSWSALGPAPSRAEWPKWQLQNGRAFPVAVSPADPNVVLVGSASGGIWRSENRGRSFRAVTDDQADLSIGSIAFSQSHPQIVYAGMGSDFLGSGILKSTDGGGSWTRLQATVFGAVRKIVVHPSDPNRVWVAQGLQLGADGTIAPAGVIVSGDGGASWTTTFRGSPDSLVLHPTDRSVLFMSARTVEQSGVRPGIFVSHNGGESWSQIYAGPYVGTPIVRIDVAPTDGGTLYAHWYGRVGDTNTSSFLRSTDGGQTWSAMAATNLSNERSTYIAVDPNDARTVWLGMRDLYKSTNGGATWTNVSQGYAGKNGGFSPSISSMHVDQRGIGFSPDGRTAYFANDGGVYRTEDGGATVESLGGALSIIQFYSIAAHPTEPLTLYGGTQDNGLELALDRTGVWREVSTGDFGPVLFDTANPKRIMTNYVFGNIYVVENDDEASMMAVASNSTFGETSSSRIAFIAPLAQRRKDEKIYFGTWRLFSTSNFGDTWTPTAGMTDLTKGSSDMLTAIGIAENQPQAIYTGSAQGRVMASRDGGLNFEDVTAGLPNRFVKSILIDENDPLTAWIGFSGYKTQHVFRTSDGGRTWLPFSEGLPDTPVNVLFRHQGVLYAGTDIGVFRRDAGAASWSLFNDGLPPVVVTDFDVTADGRIVIGTYGRGAYELLTVRGGRRRSGGGH